MIWIIYALISAFFTSFRDVFNKFGLKDLDEYIVAWSYRFLSVIFLLPLFFFFQIPQIKQGFWVAFLISAGSSIFVTILFMRALKTSDLTLTIPILSFVPVFSIIVSFFVLGERIQTLGILGILLTATGSYLLKIEKRKQGLLAPIKALFEDKGVRYMFIVTLIWSITSSFDKIGTQSSSPFFWTFSTSLFLAIALLPIMLIKSKNIIKKIWKNSKSLVPAGIGGAYNILFFTLAINSGLVAYTISIKRLSMLISVIVGFIFFKEKDMRQRLPGAVIMLIGAILISVS